MMKKYLMILIAGAFLFASCEDGSEKTNTVPADEAETKLDNMGTEMESDFSAVSESEGMDAAASLSEVLSVSTNTPLPDFEFSTSAASQVGMRSMAGKKMQTIQSVETITKGKSLVKVKETGFDYQSNTGIYAWNPDTEDFDMVEDASVITIRYPVQGSQTNNGVLTLSEYKTTTVGGTEEVTSMKASLTVDENEVGRFTMSASYDNEGEATSGQVEIFLKPVTMSYGVNNAGSSDISLNASLAVDDNQLLSTELNAHFYSDAQDSVKSMDGFFSYRKYRMEGTVRVNDLMNAYIDQAINGEMDISAFNDHFDMQMNYDGRKMGDIVLAQPEASQTADLYIELENGDKRSLTETITPVVNTMEEEVGAIFDRLENTYGSGS